MTHNRKWLLSLILVLFVLVPSLLSVGCVGDPVDTLYTSHLYPGVTNTYQVGSPTLQYLDGYFQNVYVNGVAVGGGGLELDPVFTASDSFPITAAEIATWNSLVGSQWTTDANGIHYSLGSVGFHTNSSVTELVSMYSSDGISNDPVLWVGDNSASVDSTGIRVNMTGAKTDYTDGIYITNQCTTNTAGSDKFGLRIRNTGAWNGVGSVNYGLYIETPTGGTTNTAAFIDGTLDMSDNDIENIKQVNLTDPTELTINVGTVTVTQGYHTIDTEGGAAEDFLDTINGGTTGDILFLKAEHTDRAVILRDGVGNIFLSPHVATKSFSFNSPAGGSGIYYAGGFYRASVTGINLTQAGATVNYGTANVAYGAHAFLVAGGIGTTDVGTVSIVVSGTSIDDQGNRTAADSETIVADITTMSLNAYYETVNKWLGTITYTLTPAGGATAYAADFNYGYTKYDDIGNQHFHLTDFECVGRAGANDNGFNIRLFHHSATGWTYNLGAFTPGGTVLCNMNTDYNAETNLDNGQPFAYKRDNLTAEIQGDDSEGVVVEITTSANKAVDRMGIHLQYHTTPKLFHLDDTDELVRLVYNGAGWIQ